MTNDDTTNGQTPSAAGRAAQAIMREAVRPLPKKFYKDATVGACEGGFTVLLDGRRVKTPRKRDFAVSTRPLADALVGEWAAQVDHIDPAKMPLTTLVFTALDAVAGNEEAVAAEIVRYAGSDLLCYRAEAPIELVEKQARHWDPVLRWADDALGARFVIANGLMPVTQPDAASAAVAEVVGKLPPLKLAALHVLTTLMGSALLALAVERGHLSLDDAWAAAHVDEDWQIAQWGEDAEASRKRAQRRRDAEAAAVLLAA